MLPRVAVFGAALALALSGGGLGPVLAPAPAVAAEDEWQGLPPGEGRKDVFAICGACHSLRLVTQQGLSRAVWDEALDWMVDEQEMDKLDPDERRLILEYLSAYYGPDRKARALRR